MPNWRGAAWTSAGEPPNLRDGEQVFVIRFTGEIFRCYDEYIARFMEYRKRQWSCSFSGRCNITFEQAFESEKETQLLIDEFPTPFLRPLVEAAHLFTGRLEEIVDKAYAHYTMNFMEGEEYECLDAAGTGTTKCRVVHAIPSEGASWMQDDGGEGGEGGGGGAPKAPDPSSTNYEVEWIDEDVAAKFGMTGSTMPDAAQAAQRSNVVQYEMLVQPKKPKQSKFNIKSCLRAIAQRESYTNAPWIIEGTYVEKYGLTPVSEMPAEMRAAMLKHKYKKNRENETEGEKQERLRIDEEEKQQQRQAARERRSRNAENKVSFPVDDDALADLTSTPLEFPAGLSWSSAELEPDELPMALAVWVFCARFSAMLSLNTYSFEEFVSALNHRGPCPMLSETAVALLKQALIAGQQQMKNDEERGVYTGDEIRQKARLLGRFTRTVGHGVEKHVELSPGVPGLSATDEGWEATLREFMEIEQLFSLDYAVDIETDSGAQIERIERATADQLQVARALGNADYATAQREGFIPNSGSCTFTPAGFTPSIDPATGRPGPVYTAGKTSGEGFKLIGELQPQLAPAVAAGGAAAAAATAGGAAGGAAGSVAAVQQTAVLQAASHSTQAKLQAVAPALVAMPDRSGGVALFGSNAVALSDTVASSMPASNGDNMPAAAVLAVVAGPNSASATEEGGGAAAEYDGGAKTDEGLSIYSVPALPLPSVRMADGEASAGEMVRILFHVYNLVAGSSTMAGEMKNVSDVRETLSKALREELAQQKALRNEDEVRVKAEEAEMEKARAAAESAAAKKSKGKSKKKKELFLKEQLAKISVGGKVDTPEAAELKQAQLALNELNKLGTTKLNRSDLLAHKKELERQQAAVRGLEQRVESTARNALLSDRRKHIDQLKKIEGISAQVDAAEYRPRCLGTDRHHNRYWLLEQGEFESAYGAQSMLFIEPETRPMQTAVPHRGPNTVDCWRQFCSPEDLAVFTASLNPKGRREYDLKKALLKFSATIEPGLARLKTQGDIKDGLVRARGRRKADDSFMSYTNTKVHKSERAPVVRRTAFAAGAAEESGEDEGEEEGEEEEQADGQAGGEAVAEQNGAAEGMMM